MVIHWAWRHVAPSPLRPCALPIHSKCIFLPSMSPRLMRLKESSRSSKKWMASISISILLASASRIGLLIFPLRTLRFERMPLVSPIASTLFFIILLIVPKVGILRAFPVLLEPKDLVLLLPIVQQKLFRTAISKHWNNKQTYAICRFASLTSVQALCKQLCSTTPSIIL